METTNLKRIWEIFCIFEKVEEENERVLLKYDTFYSHLYEGFLDWFSFKMLKDTIMVYNNGQIPYEDDRYVNVDAHKVNYTPIELKNINI